MFKKVITIVLPIIAITAAIFIFGLKVYQDSFDKFQYDGFVIGSSTGKESAKYHFSKDEKYKVNESKNEVVFTNTEDEEVIIPETSFVHYADGSISLFKKAVVLNLENVKTDSLQYYNIFNSSVFTKTNDGYQIKYLEQKLAFKNFIVKISDSKYMIVGKDLKIKYGEKEEIIKDGFLEINYLDGNIIRLENQDLLLQNISTDFAITVSDVKLDLIEKKIKYEEETKVNLGEITIDSDDNIEIIPDDENTKIDEEEIAKIEELGEQPVVTPGTNMDGMESGIVDTSIEKADEIIEKNEKIADPVFTVTNLLLSPTTAIIDVQVQDPEGILEGDIKWKLINTATNEVMGEANNVAQGDFRAQNQYMLEPSTNYVLIATAEYKKNGYSYQKDFLQRTIITPSAGVSIEKEYVTAEEISFEVEIPEESNLKSFEYNIVESANPDNDLLTNNGKFFRNKEDATLKCNNEESTANDETKTNICYVTKSGLKPNTKYSLVVKNITHSGSNGSSDTNLEDYEVYKTVTTLKNAPSFGATSTVVNKLSSKFIIYLNGIRDPHNSVTSFRADIYKKNEINDPTKLIAQRETTTSGQIEIGIDGVIQRTEEYQAKIYVIYNDNEKTYEKFIGITTPMIMTSVEAPTVTFNTVAVEHDSIIADLTINDSQGVILANSNIDVKMLNLSDGSLTPLNIQASKEDLVGGQPFRITVRGLRANTSYLFNVQARVQLEEGVNDSVLTNIGSFTIQTKEAEMQRAMLTDRTAENTHQIFNVGFTLADGSAYSAPDRDNSLGEVEDETGTIVSIPTDGMHEMYTMQKFVVRFRDKNFEPTTNAECTADKKCWYREFKDGTPANDMVSQLYTSTLKDNFYSAAGVAEKVHFCGGDGCVENIAQGIYKIDVSGSSLEYGTYVFEIVDAVDYTEYANKLPFEEPYKVEISINAPEPPPVEEDGFEENFVFTVPEPGPASASQNVYGANNDQNNDGTDDYTQIEGYSITPKINTEIADNISNYIIRYYLVDLKTKAEYEIPYSMPGDPGVQDGYKITFRFDDFKTYYSTVTDETKRGAEIVRGNPYGFYYTIERRGVGDAENESVVNASQTFRPFGDYFQPKKGTPAAVLYLYKTMDYALNDKTVFAYRLYDPHNSLINDRDEDGNGIGHYLKYQYDEEAVATVTCNQSTNYTNTEDCFQNSTSSTKYFAVPNKKGALDLTIEYKLMDGAEDTFQGKYYNIEEVTGTKKLLENYNLEKLYIFSNDLDGTSGIRYSSTMGQNNIKFTFDLGTKRAFVIEKVVGVKFTFESEGKDDIVLYKEFEKNGWDTGISANSNLPTITIDFAEITEMMGADNINTTVEMLYDKNDYGFGYSSTSDFEFAIQQTRNSVTTYANRDYDSKIFKKANASILNGNYSRVLLYHRNVLLPAAEDDQQIYLNDTAKGLSFKDGTNTEVSYVAKKLARVQAVCTSGCEFSFTSITPTLWMEDEDVISGLGSAEYKFKLNVSYKLQNFVITMNYYQASFDEDHENVICSSNLIPSSESDLLETRYALADMEPDANGYYVIEEPNLDFGRQYCVSFKWSALPEGETELLTNQDFLYGSTYHTANPDKPERKYPVKSKSTPTFFIPESNGRYYGFTATYDTGTLQKYNPDGTENEAYAQAIEDNNYELIQSENHNRTLTLSTTVEFLEGIEEFRFELYYYTRSENNLVRSRINIPAISASEINPTSRKMLVNIPIDAIYEDEINNTNLLEDFGSDKTYRIVVQPYQQCDHTQTDKSTTYRCGEDNLRPLSRTGYSFNYYIVNPTITITRISTEGREAPEAFAYRLTVDDRFRTVGNYSSEISRDADGNITKLVKRQAEYSVRYITEVGASDPIVYRFDNAIGAVTIGNDEIGIDYCANRNRCTIEVTYNVDRFNTGEVQQMTYTKEINPKLEADMGNISISQVSKNLVKFNISDSYNIFNTVKTIDYTFVPDTGTSISGNNTSISLSKVNATSDVYQFQLSLGKKFLTAGAKYTLTMSFKTEDNDVVSTWQAYGIAVS